MNEQVKPTDSSSPVENDSFMSFSDLLKEQDMLDEGKVYEEPESTNAPEATPPTPDTLDIEEDILGTSGNEEEEAIEQLTKTPEELVLGDNNFSNLAKTFIAKGHWENVIIENEDGSESTLEDLQNLDQETFLGIFEEQVKLKNKDIEEKYINKNGLNDNVLQLIDLAKNGGNLREAFEVYEKHINPYENLDLRNENVQASVVADDLRRKGIDEDIVVATVQKYHKDLVLDKKAQEIVGKTNNLYREFLESKSKEAIAEKQREAERKKAYKTSLRDVYRGKELKDAKIKTYIDSFVNIDKDGLNNFDRQLSNMLSNPKDAADLIQFVIDKDTYLSTVSTKVKNSNNVNNFRKIKIVKDSGVSKSETGANDQAPEDFLTFQSRLEEKSVKDLKDF